MFGFKFNMLALMVPKGTDILFCFLILDSSEGIRLRTMRSTGNTVPICHKSFSQLVVSKPIEGPGGSMS